LAAGQQLLDYPVRRIY